MRKTYNALPDHDDIEFLFHAWLPGFRLHGWAATANSFGP
jgi:hypothetical protein